MSSRIVFLHLVPLFLFAQAYREEGMAFLRNYAPKEYDAASQNFAIAQDHRGVMYFGNGDGVLEYDGVSWRLVADSKGLVVRSMGVDEKGTVFVGGMGDFGYLTPDRSGTLHFVSLLDRLETQDQDFGQMWETLATARGVYFRSDRRLFRWSPADGIKVWRSAGGFGRSFLINDTLYVEQKGIGLQRLAGDLLELMPGSEALVSSPLVCLTPDEADGLFAVSTNGQISIFRSGKIIPIAPEAAAFVQQYQARSCAALPGRVRAIGTRRGGIVLVSSEGKLDRVFNRASGMQDETVLALYPDREGSLWVALNYGITRVEAMSPLTFFDVRSGVRSSVNYITRHRGSLYAATGGGFLRMVPSVRGMPATWEPVRGAQEQTWVLLSTEDGLLGGGTTGLYEIRGDQAKFIHPANYVFQLFRSRRDPSLIYAAQGDGLVLIRRVAGHWTAVNQAPEAIAQITSFDEDADGRFWMGTLPHGVRRIDTRRQPPLVEKFGMAHGLPKGAVYTANFGGRIVFLTTKGLYRFEESGRFVPDSFLGAMFADGRREISLLSQDLSGNGWISATGANGLLRRQGDGSYRFDPRPLVRTGIRKYYTFYQDPDRVVWAGSPEGIIRYNPAVSKDYAVQPPALIRRVVTLENNNSIFGGAAAEASAAPSLPYRDHGLHFELAAPFFDDESRTEYRVRLEGFDRNWSPWRRDLYKDYTNLPEGRYVFRVEARSLYGTVSGQGTYEFIVLAPWYRRWWMYLLYLLFGMGLIGALLHWRGRHLAAKNRELQGIVADQTREVRQQAEKLQRANVELSRLNRDKDEFLGIAAHDLKNPLGAIRGYAEMLVEDAQELSPPEIIEYAAYIHKAANLMFDLVTNLLDLNRIEQGQTALELKACNLWEIVHNSALDYANRGNAKQIKLHFEGSARTPEVLADSGSLGQVVDNLISNAVKYSPRGKWIWVRVYQNGSLVRTEVQDEGPGISKEDLKKLFGKFVRLSAKPTGGESSTGLGLAIVKRLVESMGGTVWCESELGKGATFILELPVAAPVAQVAYARLQS